MTAAAANFVKECVEHREFKRRADCERRVRLQRRFREPVLLDDVGNRALFANVFNASSSEAAARCGERKSKPSIFPSPSRWMTTSTDPFANCAIKL